MVDDLRYSTAQVSGESVSRWTSGQSTRQQPQTRLPSARIKSASLVQEQPDFWHSHRTPRSVSSAITFTRLRRHVRGHHLSSPSTPDVSLRFFDVAMLSSDDVPPCNQPLWIRTLQVPQTSCILEGGRDGCSGLGPNLASQSFCPAQC